MFPWAIGLCVACFILAIPCFRWSIISFRFYRAFGAPICLFEGFLYAALTGAMGFTIVLLIIYGRA